MTPEELARDAIERAKDDAVAGLMKSAAGYIGQQKAARVSDLAGNVMGLRIRVETSSDETERQYWQMELEAERLALGHAIDSERLLIEAAGREAFLAAVDAAVEAAGRMAGTLLPILIRAATGMI